MNSSNVFGDAQDHRELAPVYAAWGTLGWDGDDDVEDLGDGSDGPEGRSMVKVTLFRGRGIEKRPVTGVAQGRQIRAQLGWPLTVVPPKGMQVVVIFPEGDMETPGNGVIMCGVQKTTTSQFKKDRGVLDLGAALGLTIKAKWVTIKDYGEAESRFPCWLTIGPIAGGTPTISCNDPTGSGWTVGDGVVGVFATDNGSPPHAKAFIQVKADSLGMGINGSGLIKLDDSGKMTVGASTTVAVVAGNVCLGAAATLATPAVFSSTPNPLPSPPLPVTGNTSTSVFISP